MRVFLFVLVVAGFCFAQSNENYNGYLDTAATLNFKADSAWYSKAFKLSEFDRLRVSVYVNDSSHAGFKGDSAKFAWGIQTFRPAWTSTDGSRKYSYSPILVVDTVDLVTATGPGVMVLGTDYSFTSPKGTIDTVLMAGWAYQSRAFAPEWDVYYRFYAKGLTGNKVGAPVRVVFQANRMVYTPVRNR